MAGSMACSDGQAAAELKAELRKTIRQQIRDLLPDFERESNEAICHRITEDLDDYTRAKTLFCFVGTKMEIDTAPIILHALQAGKTVAVPLCVAPGIMEARRIFGMDDLVPGAYGILEPKPSSEKVDPKDIDTAIVPCISCDRNCGRLGQGGGFYDRFMDKRNFSAIALCREVLMLDSVPTEPWDLSVDAVVTEERIYEKK